MNDIRLNNIHFPVFRIGTEQPHTEDGVTFVVRSKHNVDRDNDHLVYVIDDKNQPGNSLASRRLALQASGAKLYKLSKAIFFIGDLIKLAKAGTWFVDMDGQVFEYRKTTRVALKFKPVSQVIPIAGGGAIVEVKGVAARFKTLFAPNPDQKWAGLLDVGGSYILYGLYDQQYDDTYRII